MALERIRLTVVLDDDSVHDLTITNASMVAWDRARAKYNWPAGTDAPSLWSTFIAWHQMKAQGLVDCNFETFESARAVYVGDTEDEADDAPEDRVTDPTRLTPEVDSASP